MGVLSRFSTYLKSHMNAYLDRAENPAETLDYAYEQQLEQLQRLRRAFADVVTNEKRLEAQKAEAGTQMEQLGQLAQQAVNENHEDQARLALERKQQIQEHLGAYEQQIQQLKEQHQQLLELQRRLSARVEAFRTQKETMKASYGAAQAQAGIEGAATGLSEEMADVNLAVQRAHDKIYQTQARAKAMDELIQAGTLTEIGPATERDVQAELATLSDHAAVERELAALKAKQQPLLSPEPAESHPVPVSDVQTPSPPGQE